MLIAIGLGPGDPELITLKAIRLLSEADVVFVPGELAYALVAPYRSDAITLTFPMTHDEAFITACIEENARRIAPHAASGTAIFGIIGDPNFFSTFSRLRAIIERDHPEIECQTVPGISSITALPSITGIPISTSFIVTDGSEIGEKIVLKVRRPEEEAERLRREGYTGIVHVERMYMDGMAISNGNRLPEKSSYFSILHARR